MRIFYLTIFVLIGISGVAFSQNEDCATAEVICSDGQIVLNPSGGGANDFADPDNDNDCLIGNEHQSAWYYFEFQPDMPPSSQIQFTINPDGGFGEDYDFAIYGPDVDCGNLGFPLRCSYAASGCGFCPQTGLGNGTTDTSEPASGDGYVAPLIVQPGEGYYLIVDNWLGSSTGFNLEWGGSAAPFLNCEADPTCEIEVLPGGPLEVCEAAAPFSLPVTVTGTMGEETYLWTATNGGEAYLSSITELSPIVTLPTGVTGSFTYTLTVTEGVCVEMGDVIVTVLPPPQPVIDGPLALCPTEVGQLDAGAGYAAYLWSTTEVGQTISITGPGSFSVTVTDASGCVGEATFTVDQSPDLSPAISGDPTVCNGGTAILAVTDFYDNYLWSTAETTQQILVTNPGTYSVTVTDAAGCTGIASFEVVLENIVPPLIIGEPSICAGGGSTVIAVDGFYNSYLWSNAEISQGITVTAPGVYSVTVEDSEGCIAENSINITLVPPPVPQIYGETQVCFGNTTILDAGPGYSFYQWSTNEYTQVINAVPGYYSVTVTDAITGCNGTASTLVLGLEPPEPEFSDLYSICPGDTAILSLEEGYLYYQWSTGDFSPTVMVDLAGPVNVTVTDENACVGSTSTIVTYGTPPSVEITGEAVICPGGETTLDAGSGFQSYAWSIPGNNSQYLTVNEPGSYEVTVTNVEGCEGFASFTVAEDEELAPQITGNLSFCSDGQTQLDAGTGYFSYLWSNAEETQTIYVDQAGIYSVTVTDENGCTGDTMVAVQEVEMLVPQLSGLLEYCAGASTSLVAENGYDTYLWSTGDSTQIISVNTPGDISLTVTDASGCSGTSAVTVIENSLPQPEIQTEGYFCESDSVSLEVTEIFELYNWSTADTLSQIFVSQPGLFSVTVTDVNGCQASISTNIEEIALPQPQIQGAFQFCPGDTTILLGEVGYASYQWNTGGLNPDLDVSEAGDYTLSVVNDFACIGDSTVSVSELITTEPLISGPQQFCPGSSTTLLAESGFMEYSWSNGDIGPTAVYDSIGAAVLTVVDSNSCITSTQLTLSEFIVNPPGFSGETEFCTGQSVVLTGEAGFLAYEWTGGIQDATLMVTDGGTYQLSVEDTNGCFSEVSIEVTEHSLPQPLILGPTSFCIGSFTTLSADQDYADYLWSDGSIESSIQIDMEGLYGLSVTDEFGCMDSTNIYVSQETELSPQINGMLEYCENDSTIIDAGPGYASYLWSNGDTTQTITISNPGAYSVSVTDIGGCFGDEEVLLIEHPLPQPQIAGILQYCENDSTTLDAGIGYSAYLWSTNSNAQFLIVDSPGAYVVTVTDDFGCENSDEVSVLELPLPDIGINGQLFFCEGSYTELYASPGFVQYSWFGGDQTEIIQVDVGGIYGLTVTDLNTCSSTAEVVVEEVPLPIVFAGAEQFLDCDTHLSLLDASTPSPGQEIIYQWTGPGINALNESLLNPQVSVAGSYSLIASDTLHGCVSIPTETVVTDLAYQPVVLLEVLDELDCITETVLIDGSSSENGPNIIYEWFDGEGDQIHGETENSYLASSAQNYSLLVIDTLTACAAMDSIAVFENSDYPIAEAGPPQHLDCVVQEVFLNASGSQTAPSIEYQWQSLQGNIVSGEVNLIATVDEPAYYFLTVFDSDNGCFNVDSVLVTQDLTPPIASAGSDQELDCNHDSVELDAGASSSGNQFSLLWTQENNPGFFGETSLISVEMPGVYNLLVTNLSNGCTSEDQVVVTQTTAAPVALNFDVDTPTCAGDSDGSIIISEVVGGQAPYLFSMNGGPFLQTSVFANMTAGHYDVVVQDVNDCELELTIEIEDGNDLALELGPDQTIALGESVQIQALINIPDDALEELNWEDNPDILCANCAVQLFSPSETTTYGANILDENGCTAFDVVTIFVQKDREIFIPNAFSPNNDGFNDRFMIFAGKDVLNIKSFLVFNRWGESVFEVYNFPPNDPDYGWDGVFRGTTYNSAVFAWFAEVEFIDGEVILFKGDVALIK